MERNNYEQMTVSVLKNIARQMGKTRYSRFYKAGLIKKPREPTPPRKPTRKQLREKAKKLQIRGYLSLINLS